MSGERYKGDTLRNPILVTRDNQIPRNFNYNLPVDEDTTVFRSFSYNPSRKYYPESNEVPEVPKTIVIGKEDLDFLLSENVPEEALAYFEIESIRTSLSYKFVLENYTSGFGPEDPNIGLGFAYYFVGQIKQANYCSINQPNIAYYAMDSERPLELNLSGDQLRNISKVTFTYPNGVVKEAEIMEGDIYGSSEPLVNKNQIYRSMAIPGIPTYEDEIEDWFFRNGYKLKTFSFGEMSEGSEEGYSSNRPFFLDEGWIKTLQNDGIQLDRFQFAGTSPYRGILALVYRLGASEISVSKFKYSISSGKTIWIGMDTGDARKYNLR